MNTKKNCVCAGSREAFYALDTFSISFVFFSFIFSVSIAFGVYNFFSTILKDKRSLFAIIFTFFFRWFELFYANIKDVLVKWKNICIYRILSTRKNILNLLKNLSHNVQFGLQSEQFKLSKPNQLCPKIHNPIDFAKFTKKKKNKKGNRKFQNRVGRFMQTFSHFFVFLLFFFLFCAPFFGSISDNVLRFKSDIKIQQ